MSNPSRLKPRFKCLHYSVVVGTAVLLLIFVEWIRHLGLVAAVDHAHDWPHALHAWALLLAALVAAAWAAWLLAAAALSLVGLAGGLVPRDGLLLFIVKGEHPEHWRKP